MRHNDIITLSAIGSPDIAPKRKVIGLTGNPGAGKSSVSRIMQNCGARVVDADCIGHRLLKSNSPVFDNLISEFGSSILNADGEIERKKLGAIVFQAPQCLQRLNEIVHPVLVQQIEDDIQQFRSSNEPGPLVVDAALIFEWNVASRFDAVLVVTAPEDVRRKRFMDAHNGADGDFDRRQSAQMPEEEKKRLANAVINNQTDLNDLRCKIEEFMKS
jgi:dephospho-CoA kinase